MSERTLKNCSLLAALALCALLAGCGSTSSTPPLLQTSVYSTQNPLVAQILVASGCAGQVMADFGPDTTYGRSTAWYPVSGSLQRMNITVAGMRASTTYHMRVSRQCQGNTLMGNDMTFTTGALPSTPFPALKVTRPNPSLSSSESPGIELVDAAAPEAGLMQAFFTDRDANPIWYYDMPTVYYPFTFKVLPNGNLLFSLSNAVTGGSLLREVDLIGNTIREMGIGELQQKVANLGYDFVPAAYHHDFVPLDNGHVIVLVYGIKDFSELTGYPGTTLVQGDQLIDLDENWNPVWAWNSFDHLDVNRHLAGLPDWTHSNAVVYLPEDGNLLLSMRHQSWVLKIDYNNGTGTGNILWRLGYQGDFALAQGDDPSLWFSFQHFPSIISQNGSQTTLAVWDNGDSRVIDNSGTTCGTSGAPACFSRATIFQLDESARVANLLWTDEPGLFSVWGGSVNQLSNGNVEFDVNAPANPPAPNLAAEVQEVTQTATPQVIWQLDIPLPTYAYRAYRVPSLYPGVTWQY